MLYFSGWQRRMRNALLVSTLAFGSWLFVNGRDRVRVEAASLGANVQVVHDTVPAFSTNVWVFRFTGLRTAELHVRTEARLACLVFDPSGHRSDDDRHPESCMRAWIPTRTGAYRVEVRNPRRKPTAYTLTVSTDRSTANGWKRPCNDTDAQTSSSCNERNETLNDEVDVQPGILRQCASVACSLALVLADSSRGTAQQTPTRGQQVILALEAARADANRNLLETIKGLSVTGSTTVRDLVVQSSEIETRMKQFIRGARIVEERVVDDGTGVVTIELAVKDLERLLGRRLTAERNVIQAEGRGAPPLKLGTQQASAAAPKSQPNPPLVGPITPFESARPAESSDKIARVVGQGVPPNDRNMSAGQKRILAERAATQDAYRRMLEYVWGIEISSNTTVKDLCVQSDVINSRVSAFIRGAKIEEVRQTSDGVSEVVMTLDLSRLRTLVVL